MADIFSVSIDDSEVRAALQRAMTATGNLRPVMKAIGERLLRSTEDRFATETAPDGSAWKPLKDRTQSGRKILTKSHQLRGSFYRRATATSVAVGTGKIYGATHQFGRGAIPARPFLGITADDRVEIMDLLAEHLDQALTGN